MTSLMLSCKIAKMKALLLWLIASCRQLLCQIRYLLLHLCYCCILRSVGIGVDLVVGVGVGCVDAGGGVVGVVSVGGGGDVVGANGAVSVSGGCVDAGGGVIGTGGVASVSVGCVDAGGGVIGTGGVVSVVGGCVDAGGGVGKWWYWGLRFSVQLAPCLLCHTAAGSSQLL